MLHRLSVCAVLLSVLWTCPALATTPLPRDESNLYGQFDNGCGYIIRKNANPPGKVALHLHIKSGALNETDRQNGIAHFLEHMAFNGSKHFAPGELIPYLNNLGMQFGADSNAHTQLHETVYKLFMPSVDDATLEKGLTVLTDYAYGLLLLEEEIDKERGVILEEVRTGKSSWRRIFDQFRTQVLAGSRIAVHDVIGDERQIAEFSRSEFVDYWDTWYRPDTMTLIVVGDIDPQKVEGIARKHFADFQPRKAARKPLGAELQPTTQPRGFVFTDKEQVQGQAQLLVIKPARPPMKTYEDYRLNEIENLGTWIVSRRLEEMVQKGEASFRSASVGVSDFFNQAIFAMGTATGEPEDWNAMLEQVIVECHRATEHGFTEHELQLASKDLLAEAERGVEVESTQRNRRWVNRYSSAVGRQQPILSAGQRLELVKRILDSVSVGEVHQVFVENFKTPNYNYVVTLPQDKEGFTLPTNQDVLTAAKAAWNRKTTPVEQKHASDSILARLPAPGNVVERTADSDLGIITFTFANGVVAHYRFMDYKKDQVWVSITLAGGEIEETAHNRGVSKVAALANATSRLTSTQIRDLMTGKKVNVGGRAGLDTMSVSISGSPADLEDGFQLAYVMLTDPKIEQSALDNWKKQYLQQLEMMKTMPQGQLQFAMEEVLFGGDARLASPTQEQIEKLDVAKGEQWLKHITRSAPIEVAVVGDIPEDRALELVGVIPGSLPQRSLGYENLDALRRLDRGSGPFSKTVEFESITPKAVALAGFIGAEERNINDHRMLTMAALIVSDRMIKRIRENEQLVYSIRAMHRPGRGLPGLGMMFAAAPTDPQTANKLADTILEMFREFAGQGPTAEELDVARKQMANDLETQMKEPTFWLGQINQMHYRGRPLNDLKALPDIYQTFTAEQLRDAVKKYMRDDTTFRFVTIPQGEKVESPEKRAPVGKH